MYMCVHRSRTSGRCIYTGHEHQHTTMKELIPMGPAWWRQPTAGYSTDKTTTYLEHIKGSATAGRIVVGRTRWHVEHDSFEHGDIPFEIGAKLELSVSARLRWKAESGTLLSLLRLKAGFRAAGDAHARGDEVRISRWYGCKVNLLVVFRVVLVSAVGHKTHYVINTLLQRRQPSGRCRRFEPL